MARRFALGDGLMEVELAQAKEMAQEPDVAGFVAEAVGDCGGGKAIDEGGAQEEFKNGPAPCSENGLRENR